MSDPAHFRVEKFDGAGHLVLMFGKNVDRTKVEAAASEAEENVCTVASGDVCQAGTQGSAGGGEFSDPTYVAVDSSGSGSSGDVYVGDTGTSTVYQFSAAGGFLSANTGFTASEGPFGTIDGITVDTSGNLWVFNAATKMFEFTAAGEFVRNTENSAGALPAGVAVDGSQFFYVEGGFEAVEKVTATGELVGRVTRSPFSEGGLLPTGVAANVANGDVYVDVGGMVEHVGGSCNPAAGVCAVDEMFGAGQLSGGKGLAVDPGSGVVYVADAAAGVVDRYALGLEALTGAASNVTATSVTVAGSVNPEGSLVSECFFEYGPVSEGYVHNAPCAESVGSGTGSVAVHADLTGLQGGTSFQYRLAARNQAGVAHGDEASFTTLPVAVIESAAAVNVTGSEADLTAKINPEGLAASYRFEWGTSTAYGRSAPVPDGDLGSGTLGRLASVHLSGLSAGVTYHWRVQASDVNATTKSPDHTFVYSPGGGGLPDGRRYELVTPAQKNGAVIGALLSFNTPPQIAENGGDVIAPSIQCFAGAQSCVATRQTEGEPFEFARTPTGWVTHPLAPPATRFQTSSIWAVNPDTHTVLLSAPSPPNGQDEFFARQSDGALTDIGPAGEGTTTYTSFGFFMDLTPDLSHLVYETQSPVWGFDGGAHSRSLYEYVAGGGGASPVLVAVSGGSESTDLISTCGSFIGSSARDSTTYGTLSGDGRTVYFTVSPCASGTGANSGVAVPVDELYARIDQTRTVLISTHVPASCSSSECLTAPAAGAEYEGASGDGARVFFSTTQQLTDTASEDNHGGDNATLEGGECPHTAGGFSGCNLYESECPDHCTVPSERQLVAVSAGAQGTGGPRVQGAMAISPDGSHVYFVAKGVLTGTVNGSGESARDGAENLYGYERDSTFPQGHLVFIATLAQSDERQWNEGIGIANVTPDGRYLVFTSHHALTADVTRQEGPAQVYRYDYQTGSLIRISIGENAFNDNGNSGTGDASIRAAKESFATGSGPGRADPTMSHDGSYIFFQSPVGLTPQALDDTPVNETGLLAQNVYEYHNGHVALISDGKDVAEKGFQYADAVELLGTDASGANVFFSTVDQLTPQDVDTQRDYYDAHICSSTEPCLTNPTPGPPCNEDSCHNTTPAPPEASVAGSNTLRGPENLLEQSSPPTVLLLNHTAHGSVFAIKLKISGSGQITITNPATLTTRHTITKAGTYRFSIRLTRHARQALHHKHTLKLKLKLAYHQNNRATTTTTVTITIKQ